MPGQRTMSELTFPGNGEEGKVLFHGKHMKAIPSERGHFSRGQPRVFFFLSQARRQHGAPSLETWSPVPTLTNHTRLPGPQASSTPLSPPFPQPPALRVQLCTIVPVCLVFVVCFILLCWYWDQIQVFRVIWQALYKLSHPPSPNRPPRLCQPTHPFICSLVHSFILQNLSIVLPSELVS